MYIPVMMRVALLDSILLERHESRVPLSLASKGPYVKVVRLLTSETLTNRGDSRRSFIMVAGLKICRTTFSASPGRLEVQLIVTFVLVSPVIIGDGEIV